MKTLRHFTACLSLLALISVGGAEGFAKPRPRALSGRVLSVDRDNRTLTVRDAETGQALTVHVPEGTLVRTQARGGAGLELEQVLPGLTVRQAIVR